MWRKYSAKPGQFETPRVMSLTAAYSRDDHGLHLSNGIIMKFHILRWSCRKEVFHTGNLWGEEQDLVESSCRPEATVEPEEYLHTERQSHHTQADPHCPQHWHLEETKMCCMVNIFFFWPSTIDTFLAVLRSCWCVCTGYCCVWV